MPSSSASHSKGCLGDEPQASHRTATSVPWQGTARIRPLRCGQPLWKVSSAGRAWPGSSDRRPCRSSRSLSCPWRPMARPPRVVVLIVSPNRWKTISVISTEIGMAVSEIAGVRQFIRNRTTATTTRASTSTLSTLSIETWMNEAWRNRTSTVGMLFGSTRLRSPGAASISLVSLSVSALGCFCTVRITEGLPM